MVTTVCLNPAIDKSTSVEQLQFLEVNRLQNIRTMIGGKGINVAIMLKRLQTDVCCVGFVGDADQRFFERGLEHEGVCFQGILVPGNVRSNLKIIDETAHTVTEFNEEGAQVSTAALETLTKALYAKAETSSYLALCGSLPPGCGVHTYERIMQMIPGKRWIVDTTGTAMRYALREKPFLIKPNLPELEQLAGTKLTTKEAIKAAAAELCRAGASYVAVSMGGDGALVTNGEKAVFAKAVPVEVKSTVGAGDAMLAGMLSGLERGETPFDSLRYGIAAGAACVQAGSVHELDINEYASLLEAVSVTEI